MGCAGLRGYIAPEKLGSGAGGGKVSTPKGKTTPPVSGSDLIRRDALVARLLRDVHAKDLILAVAPAGYGKTVLLTSFYEALGQSEGNAFWYNCDRTDVVPRKLATFLLDVSRAKGGLAGDDSLGLEVGVAWAASQIASGLERRTAHMTVIIENYHLAQSQETDALIEAVLGIASPFLHLVISTRAKPGFASRKLMLSGRASELRVRDLAFTGSELAALARTVFPSGGEADLEGVLERTEGWPVAIRLFLLAMRDGADTKRLLEEISARDADIAEYLSEEVLRGQPQDLQDFLVATCFLEQFNSALCAAIMPQVHAVALIELAQRANLFIVKLESDSGWFRYHPIFRQYLLTQFDRLPREEQAAMRRAAGDWYETHGQLAEAVDMALLSGEAGRARSLLARLAPELVSVRGDLATFLQLLSRFPRGTIEDDSTLLYWQAWAMFFARRYRQAAALVASLHRHAQTGSGGAIDAELSNQIGLLDTLSATFMDDMVSARRAASEWLAATPGADPFDRATVSCSLVLAHLAFLDVAAARRAYDLAQRAIADSDSAYGTAWVCGIGMTMDLVAGEPRQALARLVALGAGWSETPKAPSNISSTLALLAAVAHYHLGEIDSAEALVNDNLHRLAEHGVSETAAFGLAACLRVTALKSGASDALTLARKMEAGLTKAYAPRLAFTLRYERVLLLFRAGRAEEAMEESSAITEVQPLGERRPDESDPELPSVRELRQIVAARVAIADQAWNEALRILTGLVSAARHGGRHLRLVQALILKAAVHYNQGDSVKAVRAFLDAIAVARDRGLTQIFLDDAQLCRPLVSAALAGFEQGPAGQNRELDFLHGLQLRLGLESQVAMPDDELHAPLEPLTAREKLMVELLLAGLRNREIAGRLSMSEATVKWHLYNLYSKLGVNNRTAAIHRARSLGLAAG